MTLECDYGQVCLDAFFNCKNLLSGLGTQTTPSAHLSKLLNDCAHICMGTFYAIKNGSVNATQLALLCMGICEECAEACENIENKEFKQCAEACRYCSNNMIDLAIDGVE